MTHLAFATDSTRVVTFGYFQQNRVNIPGVNNAYHGLSHHGNDEEAIAHLIKLETYQIEHFAKFRQVKRIDHGEGGAGGSNRGGRMAAKSSGHSGESQV